MSVWSRLKRVGKKAAKFEFTIALQELSIESTSHFTPGNLVLTWLRRRRRYSSKPFQCSQSAEKSTIYNHVWSMPENLEFTSTLYRGDRVQFEEKEWVCQLEDIGNLPPPDTRLSSGGSSIRRRVLATRQLDLSEYASPVPTQTSIKLNMRLASKKLAAASVLITLSALMLREGDANEEDMVSIASLMSLNRTDSFSFGSGQSINDVGRVGSFSPSALRFSSVRYPPGYKVNIPGNLPNGLNTNVSQSTNHDQLTAKLQLGSQRQSLREKRQNATCSNNADLSTMGKPKEESATTAGDTLKPLRASPSIHSEQRASDGGSMLDTETGQELLAWCQQMTAGYANVQVTDLTDSFRSGLAFCAILNRLRPDLINYNNLSKDNPVANCRLAFDVAEKMGIPRVLDPNQLASSRTDCPIDSLSVITYLHQIRMMHSGNTIQKMGNLSIDAPNSASAEHTAVPPPTVLEDSQADRQTSVVSEHDRLLDNATTRETRNEKRTSLNVTTSYNHQMNVLADCEEETSTNQRSRSAVPLNKTSEGNLSEFDSRTRISSSPKLSRRNSNMSYEHMLPKARAILRQVSEQISPPQFTAALPPPSGQFSARKPRPLSLATDPSTDASECENISNPKYDHIDPSTICSSSREPLNPTHQTNSILLDNNIHTSFPMRSSTPTSPKLHSPNDVKIRRLRLSSFNLFASGHGRSAPTPVRIGEHYLPGTKRYKSQTDFDLIDQASLQPLRSSASCDNAASPTSSKPPPTDNNATNNSVEYLQRKRIELEKAQHDLDSVATTLEPSLRRAMESGHPTADQLLKRFLDLINRKNILIRLDVQLTLMEQQNELDAKFRMLQDQLRERQSIDAHLKSETERISDEMLLQDLIKLVDERNRTAEELTYHEQAFEDDVLLRQHSMQAVPDRSKQCVLQ